MASVRGRRRVGQPTHLAFHHSTALGTDRPGGRQQCLVLRNATRTVDLPSALTSLGLADQTRWLHESSDRFPTVYTYASYHSPTDLAFSFRLLRLPITPFRKDHTEGKPNQDCLLHSHTAVRGFPWVGRSHADSERWRWVYVQAAEMVGWWRT